MMPLQAQALWGRSKNELPDPVKRKVEAESFHRSISDDDNPSNLVMKPVFPDAEWWRKFNDDYLTFYINEALKANPQLGLAQQRIEEERGLARQAFSRQLPQVNLIPSVTRTRTSANSFGGGGIGTSALGNNTGSTGANGASAAGGAGGTSSTGNSTAAGSQSFNAFSPGRTINFFNLPVSMSYEADIFLKNRDRTKAQKTRISAAERQAQAIQISLVADVATAYINLLAADKQITLQENYVEVTQDALNRAQKRFEAGFVSQEDVIVSQGSVSDAQAVLQSYFRQRTLFMNQLALLLGKAPEEVPQLPRGTLDTYLIPDEVAGGIPSQLVARRPDIQAQEDILEASRIDVRAARKEFLPTINLTGQAGLSSLRLNTLFDWDSRLYSLGANAIQSLFTGGFKRGNVEVFRARYGQQLYQYNQTLLQSFREVNDAMGSLQTSRNAYYNYVTSVEALEQQLQLQQGRFQAGAISKVELNPTYQQILLSQQGLAQAKLATLVDSLTLYRALGGGY